MRSALTLLLAVGTASAQTLPTMPEPEIPPYEAPRVLIDGLDLQPGITEERDGGFWYDGPGHLRVVLSLSIAERLSDDRARAAWRGGWLRAANDFQAALTTEHAGRLRAEARAEVLEAVQPSQAGTWDAVVEAAPWVVVALAAGFAAGLLVAEDGGGGG